MDIKAIDRVMVRMDASILDNSGKATCTKISTYLERTAHDCRANGEAMVSEGHQLIALAVEIDEILAGREVPPKRQRKEPIGGGAS